MSSKTRRRKGRKQRRIPSAGSQKSVLRLESLEQRLLLDVAGLWDELGYRSASGGGISWDTTAVGGEAKLIESSDGDPVVFWIEGQFNEWVEQPIPFRFEMDGDIYARQYGGDTGWWDLEGNTGDVSLGTGRQLAATAGPEGQMGLAWVTGTGAGSEIVVRLYDGQEWADQVVISNDGVLNEQPDIVFNESGEIFVSYTALHPRTGQREIVVQRYGEVYQTVVQGPPTAANLQWSELVGPDVGDFGENDLSGATADTANSFTSSLAVDIEGRPYLAWVSRLSEGNADIYVKRWDGTAWQEWGLGSASDPEADGIGGVSNDGGFSLDPDIAIAENGDVIVAWANWANWTAYDTNGQAGIYVRALRGGDAEETWDAYQANVSTVGAGVAGSLGWYWAPEIDTTSDSRPFVVWQGFGAGERYAVDRDNDPDTPGLPGNRSNESPIMAVYGSVFDADEGFTLLPDATDPTHTRANPYAMIDAMLRPFACWMPTGLVGPNDELVLGYTWRDSTVDPSNHDWEIFVQAWNDTLQDWESYGRGAQSNGNDVFGGPENSSGSVIEETFLTNIYVEGETQIGLIDYDANPATEYDVVLANGDHVYVYSRQTDAWQVVDPPLRADTSHPYGEIFDLKGEPEVEYDVQGSPLLAYVDTDQFSPTYGQAFVAKWEGGGWTIVGNGPASDTTRPAITPQDTQDVGKYTGIATQAGPNGQILVAYTGWDGRSTEVYTRLWDGVSWVNAGQDAGGVEGLLQDPNLLQAVYHANYDGEDWEDFDLTTIDIQNGRRDPAPADYEVGHWYFDPTWVVESRRDWLSGDSDATAGPRYVPEDPDGGRDEHEDPAMVLTLAIPAEETAGFNENTTPLLSHLDYQFEMIYDGHITVETMLDISTLNMTLDLYWAIDGAIVDADPTDLLAYTPVMTVGPGGNIGWVNDDSPSVLDNRMQGPYVWITLDSKEAGIDPLVMGEHRVSFWAEARPTYQDLGPNAAPGDDELPAFRFPGTTSSVGDGWTFDGDGAGVWAADAGIDDDADAVVEDGEGGLRITLDDAAQTATQYIGWFERDITIVEGEEIEVGLRYTLDGSALTAPDELGLLVTLVGPDGTVYELTDEATGDLFDIANYTVAAGAVEDYDATDWLELNTTNLTALGGLDAGTYTIRVQGVLTDADATDNSVGVLLLDNMVVTSTTRVDYAYPFQSDPLMDGWVYLEADGGDAAVDGYYQAGAGTGFLQMDFTGLTAGEFAYAFEYGGPVTIEFDYELLSGAAGMEVWIDGNKITADSEDEGGDREWILLTEPEAETFEVTLTGLGNDYPGLNRLASGWHNIEIVVAADAGTSFTIDNFRLYGADTTEEDYGVEELPDWLPTDPHRAVVRMDNFAVYQRTLQDSGVPMVDVSFEFPDINDLGDPIVNMGAWTYNDVDDPGDANVTGVWGTEGGSPWNTEGGLVMTLGDGENAVEDLGGRFEYAIGTLTTSGYLGLDLDYFMAVGSLIDPMTPLALDIYVENANTGRRVFTIHTDEVFASGLGGGAACAYSTRQLDFNKTSPATGDAEYYWTTLANTGLLQAGDSYRLVVEASLGSSGATAVGDPIDDALGQAIVWIDNIQVSVYLGAADWETPSLRHYSVENSPDNNPHPEWDTGSDGPANPSWSWGSNDAVGPDPDRFDGVREGEFNFDACQHIMVTGNGTASLVFPEIEQWESGQMIIGFRYRLDAGMNLNPVSLTFTNPADPMFEPIVVNEDGDEAPLNLDLRYGWWNYVIVPSSDREYATVVITANGIPAMPDDQPYDVKLELQADSGGVAITNQLDFYVDNMFIFATPVTHVSNLKAALLPTGAGGRDFAVLAQGYAPGMYVWDDVAELIPEGDVRTAVMELPAGYTGSRISVMTDGDWAVYGNEIKAGAGKSFWSDVDDKTMPGSSVRVPIGDSLYVEDMAIGPNGTLWAAIQHAAADWVDPDANVKNDEHAIMHPWDVTNPPAYWHAPTDLLLEVWAWDPFNDPLDVTGDALLWRDMQFTPINTAWAYTDIEITATAGQSPIVAWSPRGALGSIGQVSVQRYGPQGAWEVLNDEEIENGVGYWTAGRVRDLIARPDGMPIVSYYGGHLDSDALREFRRTETLPSVSVTEGSGASSNDGKLEFGTTLVGQVDQTFSVANNGPGELVIYDVEFGGYGDLDTNPFSLTAAPQFPVRLDPGESRAFTVRFDPTGVDPGVYEAVAVVHTNDMSHPTHPFTHFQELWLTARVGTTGEIQARLPGDVGYLRFEETVIDTITTQLTTGVAAYVEIKNLPDVDGGELTIQSWRFAGANFQVQDVILRQLLPNGDFQTDDSLALDNPEGPAGDIVLTDGSILEIYFAFAPDEVDIFNDTFYITTDDDDEPVELVAMTGTGLSGARLELEEQDDEPGDGEANFGYVIMGTTSDPIPFTLRNEGSTVLEIYSIQASSDPADLFTVSLVTTPSQNDPLIIQPGNSYTFYVQFLAPQEIGARNARTYSGLLNVTSNDADEPNIVTDLLAVAVPLVPLVEVREDSGREANDNFIEFGTVAMGGVVTQEFTLQNIGGAPLTVQRLVIPTVNSPFILSPKDPGDPLENFELAPGEEQQFIVTYNPQVGGEVENRLLIYTNAQVNKYELILQGDATNPSLIVTDSVTPADDRWVDFGPVATGGQREETVTLTNTGSSPVTISGWHVSDGTEWFTVSPSFGQPVVLAGGQSYELTVEFAADIAGTLGGTLEVASDDPSQPLWEVALQGTGVAPGAVAITDSQDTTPTGEIHFTGLVCLQLSQDSLSTEQLTLTNIGQTQLQITGIELVTPQGQPLRNSPFEFFQNGLIVNPAAAAGVAGWLLQPTGQSGDSLVLDVVFNPLNGFEATALVNIYTTVPNTSGPAAVSQAVLQGDGAYAWGVGDLPTMRNSRQDITDADGDTVTISVSGGGYATIVLAGGVPGGADIEEIRLFDTTDRTTLKVTTNGETTVQQIIGGAMGSVILKGVTLNGAGEAVSFDSLSRQFIAEDITNGADLDFGEADARGLTVKLGDVGDGTDLVVDGDIRLLAAQSFGDSQIQSDNMQRLLIQSGRFDATVNVAEDLGVAILKGASSNADFWIGGELGTLNGPATAFSGMVQAGGIGQVRLGALTGAQVTATGNIARVILSGDMTASRLLSGYDLLTEDLFSASEIVMVKVGGRFADSVVAAGVAPYSGGSFFAPDFQNDTVSGSIGRVQFGEVEFDNADEFFGVAARSEIGQVRVGRTSFEPDAQQDDFIVRLLRNG